jgi:spore coat protein A
MRFNIVPATRSDPPLSITTSTDLTAGNDPSLVGTFTASPLPPPPGVPVRILTLNEDFDSFGRLVQRVGTNARPAGKIPGNSFGRNYMDVSTENPLAGTTEVWQIINTTADAHPMHFHLVNVQILQRQPFNSFNGGTPNYSGPATGPDLTELGWKETVKMYPGTVTTVIMRFDLPGNPPGIASMPNSPNPNLGVSGKEYVWHCHILEHEEHDMMRPLVVV